MAWDDQIKQTLEQIAVNLKCQVTQTNGGCIFNYKGKEFYFSYFMNSKPNDTFKMVYNKDYIPRKSIGHPVAVGDYKLNQEGLDKARKEIIVKIIKG